MKTWNPNAGWRGGSVRAALGTMQQTASPPPPPPRPLPPPWLWLGTALGTMQQTARAPPPPPAVPPPPPWPGPGGDVRGRKQEEEPP